MDLINIAGTADPQRPAVAQEKSSDDIFSPENAFIPKKVIAGRSAISLLSIPRSKTDFLESQIFRDRRFAQFPAIWRICALEPAIANP
jgi:hypothetical protein